MSTSAQILANQANSLHSTGPVTTAGKAASSMNRLDHGLRSNKLILPGEDSEAYDELAQKYMDECQPATEEELFCVTEMINAQWRLRRVEDAEHRLLSTDPDAILNGGLDKLERYRTSITRAFYRASQHLARLRKEADQQHRQQIKDETARLDAELKAYIFAPMPTARPETISDDELEALTRPESASNGKIASSR